MKYVLEANGIYKNYGHFRALDGLTMHVPEGAIYGFVGKNGAGKTTLIRIICGLQSPSSGEYKLWGQIPPEDGRGGRNAVDLSRHDRRGQS